MLMFMSQFVILCQILAEYGPLVCPAERERETPAVECSKVARREPLRQRLVGVTLCCCENQRKKCRNKQERTAMYNLSR